MAREVDGDVRLDGNVEITGNLAVGISSPQGRFHLHDGTGGVMFVTKTNINGSAQTIIPDGTDDVAVAAMINYVLTSSAGTDYGSQGVSRGSSFDISVGGGSNVFRITCQSNGQLEIARTTGTPTASISMLINWL